MPTSSTKQLVQISDIQDNVIVLTDRSLRMIIEVSSINFELRSEEEQLAIIGNFQNFLNSIDFPLQIVISSRKYNITEYLKTVQETIEPLTNELLKMQADEYQKFIGELAELSNIMTKRFYIVVPFYGVPLGAGGGFLGRFKGIFGGSSKTPVNAEQLETYKRQLLQRAELVFDGLIGLGVKARVIEQQELMSIFYSLYNPESQPRAAAQKPELS
jgi:hypothetical protein